MISLAHMPRPGAAMESAPDAVCETLRCELPDGRVIIARIHTEEGEAEHRRARTPHFSEVVHVCSAFLPQCLAGE